MPSRFTLNKALPCLYLLFLLSCSSQKPADTGEAGSKTADSAIPKSSSAYSVEIAPHDAKRNTVFYVIPNNFSLSSVRHIEWTINGVSVSDSVETSFKALDAKRGDIVQANITGPDFKISSNAVEIGNSPPEIATVKFMPEVLRSGDTLYADVTTSDADGDPVTVSYEWTVDGQPAGQDQHIGVQLKRGNKILLKVTPFDGINYGTPFMVETVVSNMPPVIEEHTASSFDGTTYTYQVKATDPDGDPLTYSLGAPPQGMSINASTGLLTWIVPPTFKGVQPVMIVVNDGHGGTAQYTLNVTVK